MKKISNSQQVSEALTVTIPRLRTEKAELLGALKECVKQLDLTYGPSKVAYHAARAVIIKLDDATVQASGKIKVLCVDQWTSTGNVGEMSFADFDPAKVSGWVADAIRKIGVSSAQIFEVTETESPRLGTVWFKEDPKTGKLVRWKTNYDSSD
jgi:hypothetical protein